MAIDRVLVTTPLGGNFDGHFFFRVLGATPYSLLVCMILIFNHWIRDKINGYDFISYFDADYGGLTLTATPIFIAAKDG